MEDPSLQRLEAALRGAVAAHRTALRDDLRRQTRDFSLRFLLARLAVAPADLDAVAAADAASDLEPGLRAEIGSKLAVEAARLLRLARAASPSYDINRHIAVRHAALWIADRAPAQLPTGAEPRGSGKALNSLFATRGRRRGRRMKARPSERDAQTSC